MVYTYALGAYAVRRGSSTLPLGTEKPVDLPAGRQGFKSSHLHLCPAGLLFYGLVLCR